MTAQRVPLYVDRRRPVRICLEERALQLRSAASADRYIPLRRLSRLVLHRRTAIDSRALLACAEESIPVVFYDDRGQVIARLSGRAGLLSTLGQRLADLLDRYDWQERYDLWLYATQRMAVIRIGKALHIGLDIRTPRQMTDWSFRQARRYSDPETAANTREWFHLLCYVWMAEQLQHLGIGARESELLDGGPDLIGDLSQVMAWELEPLRLGWLRRRHHWMERHASPPRPVKMRDMVKLFEDKRPRVYRVGRGLINRLHQWLKEA